MRLNLRDSPAKTNHNYRLLVTLFTFHINVSYLCEMKCSDLDISNLFSGKIQILPSSHYIIEQFMPNTCVSGNTTLNVSFFPVHLWPKCALYTIQNIYAIWQIDKHPFVRYEIVTEESSLLGSYAVSHGKHFPTCDGPYSLHILRYCYVTFCTCHYEVPSTVLLLLTFCICHYEDPSKALCTTDILYLSL